MLGKLLKHEWKSMLRVGSIALLVMLGLTVIGYLFLRFSSWVSMMENEALSENWLFSLVTIFGAIIYVMAYCGVCYGMMFYVGFRFYKSMYSGQGYLTHTLPVTPAQLLISKVLVSGVWLAITYLVMVLSCIILIMGAAGGDGMLEAWKEIFAIYDALGFFTWGNLLFVLFVCVTSPFVVVMQVFGSFTVGQLCAKHRVLMGFVVYIGTLFASYIVSMVAQVISLAGVSLNMANPNALSTGYLFAGTYASLFASYVTAIVLGILSYRILKNKLNLN